MRVLVLWYYFQQISIKPHVLKRNSQFKIILNWEFYFGISNY